jgi:hypothetical protein
MERGGLTHVQITIVGHRRPEFADLAQGQSGTLFVRADGIVERPMPVLGSSLRVLPSDIWLTRRIRRVPAMLAADDTAHAKVATLALV